MYLLTLRARTGVPARSNRQAGLQRQQPLRNRIPPAASRPRCRYSGSERPVNLRARGQPAFACADGLESPQDAPGRHLGRPESTIAPNSGKLYPPAFDASWWLWVACSALGQGCAFLPVNLNPSRRRLLVSVKLLEGVQGWKQVYAVVRAFYPSKRRSSAVLATSRCRGPLTPASASRRLGAGPDTRVDCYTESRPPRSPGPLSSRVSPSPAIYLRSSLEQPLPDGAR